MAERVNLVADHLGDGAGGTHIEIAAQQVHADRIARLQAGRVVANRLSGRGGRGAGHRREAVIAKRAGQEIGDIRAKSAHHQRRRNGPQHRGHLTVDARACRSQHLHVARTFGEWAHPRERRTQRIGHAFLRHRHLEPRPHANRRSGRVERGRIDHLGNRRDARERLFRERAEGVRDSTRQSAVDVHRASAHAGDDAGIGERAPFEPGQNQIAPRSNHVPEHAENVNLELFDFAPLPNGEPGGFHAGLDLIDGKVGAGRRQRHRQQRHAREEGENKSLHIVVIRGKPSVAIVAQTLTKSKTS